MVDFLQPYDTWMVGNQVSTDSQDFFIEFLFGHVGICHYANPIGNEDDRKTDIDCMLDLSAAVKQAPTELACAIRDVKLPRPRGR